MKSKPLEIYCVGETKQGQELWDPTFTHSLMLISVLRSYRWPVLCRIWWLQSRPFGRIWQSRGSSSAWVLRESCCCCGPRLEPWGWGVGENTLPCWYALGDSSTPLIQNLWLNQKLNSVLYREALRVTISSLYS